MQQPQTQSRKAIAIFLLLTFSLSSIYYFLMIHIGKIGAAGGLYVIGLMWSPALSAFITCRILKKEIAGLGWSWNKPGLLLWCYLIPLGYALVSYLIIWTTGWGGFYNTDFVVSVAKSFGWDNLPNGAVIILFFILLATVGMVRNLSTALGEEIGWRGFLVPEVFKATGSYTKTSLITGVIWSLWHFPILIFADYNSGTPAWYGLSCFTVMVVSSCFIYTWFRLKSNSLWTGAIIHASHNLFIQRFFTPITQDTGHTKYFIDEFGVVVPIISLLVGIYFWSRRGELEA